MGDAANTVLEKLFSDEFKKASLGKTKPSPAAVATKGTKRKPEGINAENKSKLMRAIQSVLATEGTYLTKTSIVYSVEEAGGKYTATVSIEGMSSSVVGSAADS